jgi:pullulanase
MEKSYETYSGNDLGVSFTPDKTSFRLWAPAAKRVQLCLYSRGDGDCLTEKADMEQASGGTWLIERSGDLKGAYYTFLITEGADTYESADPYARAAGVNGRRSMVVDLSATNPDGFLEEQVVYLSSPTDAVICEVSVADITNDETSGVRHKGKFLGLAETGTKSGDGMPTGLDYLKSLGVTHLQLMPIYDFGSIDEADTESEQYNWGYDPVNYNVPEGSYSTDPYHGEVRIRELKTMIHAIHAAGMGVIMDVVYNHTYDIGESWFQKTAPDYFYRMDENGYSNGSGCGNEVATEREMVRKYIVDSLVYWMSEYHIDGFRFDLMGVLDLVTMQQISDKLHTIRPDVLLYGEGWTGGESSYPVEKRAVKANISALDRVGAFSDDIRDSIRGHVFYHNEPGFVNGKPNMENAIRYSVVGASEHPQVDYGAYSYTATGPWAKNPEDVINYISCHDNLTLWDKLQITCPDAAQEELLAMNRLAAAILFTSQGIPFFLSGEEFGRTKPVEGTGELSENSYNLSRYTNNIHYDRAATNQSLLAYYRGLIAFRRQHSALRMAKSENVRRLLTFLDNLPCNTVAYTVSGEDEKLFVAYNAGSGEVTIDLPESGEYQVFVNGTQAGTEVLESAAGQVTIPPVSAVVAVNASSC